MSLVCQVPIASHVAAATGFGKFLKYAPFHCGTAEEELQGDFASCLGEGYWTQQL